MPVKINSFGGPLIWLLRKHCSNITSRIMLYFVSRKYQGLTKEFIKAFLNQKELPVFQNVMIETINRCNGECSFCPANIKDESRPLKIMSVEMYHQIINQLVNMQWRGKLFMQVNNEPFIDKRIIDFMRYAKESISDVKIVVSSNGTLLNIKQLDELIGIVDQLIINNYSAYYSLSSTQKSIYAYIKDNASKFKDMEIIIRRRYSNEILATRAGNAPNKPQKNVKIECPCVYPFTDLTIFPDGQVGMCCNDCREISHFGDIKSDSLLEIWGNEKFRSLRMTMLGGRNHFLGCQDCDVLDAGERETFMKRWLRDISTSSRNA